MNEDTALDLEFAITELEPRKNPSTVAQVGSGGGHFGGSGGHFGGSGGGSGT